MAIPAYGNGNGNGGVDLRLFPIGFRFQPTDEELVVHYLKRKAFSPSLSEIFVPENDNVFSSNPWDLPGDLNERMHFFCKKRYNLLESFSSDSGYWRATGKEKQIRIPGSNFVTGVKKWYVFHQGRNMKTQWVMHEFSLVGSLNSPPSTQKMQLGDWVVCRLYWRHKRGKKQNLINKFGKRRRSRNSSARDPWVDAPCSCSSSCSSVVTEVSCNDSVDQEASSF